MIALQMSLVLISFGILATAVQVITTQWGLPGDLIGGAAVGLLSFTGWRLFARDTEHRYLIPLIAAIASLVGLATGQAGSGRPHAYSAWIGAPLIATLPTGWLTLHLVIRSVRCQLCHTPLRRLLSFSCPRCHLIACENCWQFERGRCHLCDENHVALFPLDNSWWSKFFGPQVRGSRCALCLRAEDWQIAHWACGNCGHAQCRQCWDDNNGQCSRCGWTVSDLPTDVDGYVRVGSRSKLVG